MTFHWYGFLIGLALILMSWLGEKVFCTFVKDKTAQKKYFPVFFVSLLASLVGARLWHVFTSWPIYQNNWQQIFNLPAGGLSILGALVFGVAASWIFFYFSKTLKLWPFYLDSLAFVLPLAQSLGRIGNFINQELYGYPSKIGWAILIKLENRPVDFANYTHFHPLFLYEILPLLVFAIIWWRFYYRSQKKLQKQFGTAKIFLLYLLFYLCLRFFLDFIRIDKALLSIPNLYLGVNQLIIFLLFLILAWPTFKLFKQQIKFYFLLLLSMGIAIIFSQQFSWAKLSQAKNNYLLVDQSKTQSTYQQLKKVKDHSLYKILVDKQVLEVEVVNTSASITQGLSGRSELGADGMLFVFPEARQTTFWMKEMTFDLDLVWIFNDLVFEITQDVPHPEPNTSLNFLPRYSPRSKVEMVLELDADQNYLPKAENQQIYLLDF